MSPKNARPPKPALRGRPTYSEEERIAAVTILIQSGGLTREAVTLARQMVKGNPSISTLARWWMDYQAKIVQERPDIVPAPVDVGAVVDQTRDLMLGKMKSIISKLLDKLDDDSTINAASLRDASVSFGIFYDKLESMLTLTPDEAALWRRYRQACSKANYDHMTALEDFCVTLEGQQTSPSSIAIMARPQL